MKSLLICPDIRKGVSVFGEAAPFSNVPLLGRTPLEYWLAHLAALNAKEVIVVTADRSDEVRAAIGNGDRWGLKITVQEERREPDVEEARAKYQDARAAWLPAPNDIVVMDHLPCMPHLPLLTSYADWFAVVRSLIPTALTPDRIGVREVTPGVWVGLHTHVASGAKLIAPCWIEESCWIEAEAVIGPNTVLERETFISRGAEISQSVIGPRTFVGQFTEIHNSIAWGNILINWERDSCAIVSDEFLLCSLEPHRDHLTPAKPPSLLRLREYVSHLVTSVFAESGPPR